MAMPIANVMSAAPVRAAAQVARQRQPEQERPPPQVTVETEARASVSDSDASTAVKAAELPREDPKRGSPASYSAMAQLSKALERGDLDAVEQAFQALRLRRSSVDIGRPLINVIA